jgi:predicted ribosome quality control (RQC) complex YloA/Tae2 family protein
MPDILTAIQAVSRDGHGPLDPEEEVREGLARALQRAEGRVRGIRRELAQAADPEEPRAQANLLLARLAEIPRGAGSVTLRGFDGEEVRIDLDPAARPQENAARLYEEAARRERARERLPVLLEKAQGAVRRLEAVAEGLGRGSITVEEARRRIPRTRKPSHGRGREEERLPFRRYLSSGGLEIRVGRSSRDNDALTFRHSHPEDVWLHARDRAGAHVILRWHAEGNPPQRDLAEAAVLAALHSGARSSASVPVDWTRRKYVRKPRKAPPGTVVPERVQTLFVEPDPALPERLRNKEEQAEEHPDQEPKVRSPRPSPAGDP